MLEKGPHTRDAFDGALRRLVGRSVRSVSYHEIAYEVVEPGWRTESESFDSLDFGLELLLDDGSIVSFTWGAEFVQYNVSVLEHELQLGDSARRWDVDTRWRALGLIDSRILDATSVWLSSGFKSDVEYPQDVRITFEAGRVVVISAFELRRGDLAMGMTDHITVFFDEAEATRLVHRMV